MPQEVIKKIIWMLPGMNTLAEALGITCTADIGLMSIEYTCYDGEKGFTQSLCLTNTGVNTLKLNRLEHFIQNFEAEGKHMSGEQLHTFLDNIEKSTWSLFLACTGTCSSNRMLWIYISTGRRSD